MRGPGSKGHAEMAVSRVKGSGPETPIQTPDSENFNFEDFEEVSFSETTLSQVTEPFINCLTNTFFCVCACVFPLDSCASVVQDPYAQRRMSDPSQSWNNFLRGSFKRSGIRKSRSETSNVDIIGDGTSEVEATHIEDGQCYVKQNS